MTGLYLNMFSLFLVNTIFEYYFAAAICGEQPDKYVAPFTQRHVNNPSAGLADQRTDMVDSRA